MLRVLNNGTSRLDHLITTSKSFGDHNDIGYKGESSSTKTMFVKSGLLVDTVDVSNNKPVVKYVRAESKFVVQQSVATGKSMKISRQKRKGKNLFQFIIFVV